MLYASEIKIQLVLTERNLQLLSLGSCVTPPGLMIFKSHQTPGYLHRILRAPQEKYGDIPTTTFSGRLWVDKPIMKAVKYSFNLYIGPGGRQNSSGNADRNYLQDSSIMDDFGVCEARYLGRKIK